MPMSKHSETERDDFLGKNPMRRPNKKDDQHPERKREKDMGDSL